MNISYYIKKIKSYKEILTHTPIFVVFMLFLVGFLAFGLGRIYQMDSSREPLRVYYATSTPHASYEARQGTAAQAITDNTNMSSVIGAVASKNSNKYHLVSCGSANSISEANKITFSSAEEAEQAGYTLAGNCRR